MHYEVLATSIAQVNTVEPYIRHDIAFDVARRSASHEDTIEERRDPAVPYSDIRARLCRSTTPYASATTTCRSVDRVAIPVQGDPIRPYDDAVPAGGAIEVFDHHVVRDERIAAVAWRDHARLEFAAEVGLGSAGKSKGQGCRQ